MKKRYDEMERSKIWKVVMISSTIVIFLVLIYLLTKLFASNPLEGRWKFPEGDMELQIKGGQKGQIRLYGLEDEITIKVDCVMDKEAKTLRIKANEKALRKWTQAGYKEEEVLTQIAPLVNTFYYSLEENRLILTEREYGEQLVLVKE